MKDDPAAVGSGRQGEAEGKKLSKSYSEGPSTSLGKWHEDECKRTQGVAFQKQLPGSIGEPGKME